MYCSSNYYTVMALLLLLLLATSVFVDGFRTSGDSERFLVPLRPREQSRQYSSSLKEVLQQLDQRRHDVLGAAAIKAAVVEKEEDTLAHEMSKRESPPIDDDPTVNRADLVGDDNTIAILAYTGITKSEVIFLMTFTRQGGLATSTEVYRSTNYGISFNKITDDIVSGGAGGPLVPAIFISPENHEKVYFLSGISATIYVSEDAGDTFRMQALTPNTINPYSIVPHPTMDDWLLGFNIADNSMYISRDLGQSFIYISDNVTSYDWGHDSYDKDLSTVFYISNEILYTQRQPYTSSTRERFDLSLTVYQEFLIVDRYLFVANLINDVTVDLWVSVDRKPLRQAVIPSSLNRTQFLVNSIRSIQVLAVVQHDTGQYNLYLSGEEGVNFFQSLAGINHLGGIFFDLEVVQSSNYTTYVANQRLSSSQVRTLISFDAGANWHPVTPPDDSETNCRPPSCSLHFHLDSSIYRRTSVHSPESAPGIILAHGVTGRFYSLDTADLYISTDGGLTWSLTLEGTWGVQVIDHGSLIVAARDYTNDRDASRTLMYSCDEGMSWTPLTFNPYDITIYGVGTEPGENSVVVSIFGVENLAAGTWVVIVIDFANVFPSDCMDDDYYLWRPVDQFSDNGCYLGANVTIERRRPDVCCRNGHSYARVVDFSVCACTLEDYQCDYGYKHANGFSGACVRDEDVSSMNSSSMVCNDNGYQTQSQGYRKIGGDVCMGGRLESNLLPINISCSSSASSLCESQTSYFIAMVFMIVLFLICVLVIFGLIFYISVKLVPSSKYNHEQFTDTASTITGMSVGTTTTFT